MATYYTLATYNIRHTLEFITKIIFTLYFNMHFKPLIFKLIILHLLISS